MSRSPLQANLARYPLRAVEKKWIKLWGLETPLALLDKEPAPSEELSPYRFWVYQDISLRLGYKTPLEKSAPLIQTDEDATLHHALETYGIDATRLYLVSDNPPNVALAWNENALEGAWKFVNSLWQKFLDIQHEGNALLAPVLTPDDLSAILNAYHQHQTHKALAKIRGHLKTVQNPQDFERLCTLLAPVMPCITSEIASFASFVSEK